MAKSPRVESEKARLPSERVERQSSDGERRENQAARLARVLRLLEMLADTNGVALHDLSKTLGISTRTIRRDLRVLEAAGYRWEAGKQDKRYRLQAKSKFPFAITKLSDDELLGQVMAGIIALAPGLEPARGARRMTNALQAQLHSKHPQGELGVQILTNTERLVGAFSLSLADHSRSQDVMRKVQHALLTQRQVSGDYVSPYQATPERLRLHPYRLCLIKQAWYLIARPDDAKRPKTYRIARFSSLEETRLPAQTPDDFDLRAYFGNAWAVFRGEKTYDVEIAFNPEAAPLVLETLWHHTQRAKKHRDGSVTLSFRVDGLDEIVHWVLSWSGRAKVVRPKELRDLVLEHLRQALQLNAE